MTVDLENELVALGDYLAAPTGEGLAIRVAAQVATLPSQSRRWRRRIVALIAAFVAGAAIAAPTVADWLGVGGIEVRQAPPPVRPRIGGPLQLGRAVTIRAAQQAAGFVLAIPSRLGPPDEVWVEETNGTPVVSFIYRARPGLPAAAAVGIGALISQADVGIADQLLATKFAGPSTRIETVDLGSGRALWIEGGHAVAFHDRRGQIVIERLRLADNVLLWERGRVTLRIETALGRDEAIQIAESVE